MSRNSFTELLRLCVCVSFLCANTPVISYSSSWKMTKKFLRFLFCFVAFESYWIERGFEKKIHKESQSFVEISFCCFNVVILCEVNEEFYLKKSIEVVVDCILLKVLPINNLWCSISFLMGAKIDGSLTKPHIYISSMEAFLRTPFFVFSHCTFYLWFIMFLPISVNPFIMNLCVCSLELL